MNGAVTIRPCSFICRNSRQVPGAGRSVPIVILPGAVDRLRGHSEGSPPNQDAHHDSVSALVLAVLAVILAARLAAS